MTTTATVRGLGAIDDATAARIADLWNLAYPGMRETLTNVISNHRAYLKKAEQAERLSEEMKSNTRRRIKRMEETRLALGQLDRGTYRGCTRSPGMFDASDALSVVRRALGAFPFGSPHAGNAYRLAAELSDVVTAQSAERMATHSSDA